MDCRQKAITFQIPSKPMYVYYDGKSEIPGNLVSALCASKLLNKGCISYLASV